MSWPYPTVRVDGIATVDENGENQVCACGNDSATHDWRSADRHGRLTFDAAGSSDPDEFAVCPECGRVYSNRELFASGHVPAVARFDVDTDDFIEALALYDRLAYRGPAY